MNKIKIPQEYQAHVDFMERRGLLPGTTDEQFLMMESLKPYKVYAQTPEGFVIHTMRAYYFIEYDGKATLLSDEKAKYVIKENS